MQHFDNQTIEKIRRGYYSAVYFNRTKQILLDEKNMKPVTMQVFQKNNDVTLCGVNEVIELLKVSVGFYEKDTWISKRDELKVTSLKDGDSMQAWETVMHIEGPYAYFAHLESLYLGILARGTKIATNARKMVTEANGKPVVCFADRFDHFLLQEHDGYAAKIGGVEAVTTIAQTAFLKNEIPRGTLPHALIAVYGGNTLLAAEAFAKQFPDVPLIVLVDFENKCVETALAVAKKFGNKLWGVRLDTAENMVDASLEKEKLTGVNPLLVKNVREALDSHGFSHVKIVVSGGFDAQKIALFEKEQTQVDVYGVGSSLMRGQNDFTADVVRVDGKPMGKQGRTYKPNSRLQRAV